MSSLALICNLTCFDIDETPDQIKVKTMPLRNNRTVVQSPIKYVKKEDIS